MMDWQQIFSAGLSYEAFLEQHGTVQHRQRWQAVLDAVALSPEQRELLAGFSRQMNVLCLAGAWCGDCVNQCPMFHRFTEATERIELRFLDRDKHMDVQKELSICGGNRVPVLVFLSEDFAECGRYGERTLSKYRDLAKTQLGAACPTGIVGADRSGLATVTSEWLAEFERMQLMLRLSPRLRERHGD